MLGNFISWGLFAVLGYAYPAFECFKTVERENVDVVELRFWCQYWIIVAVLSVCERFGDIFISWIPFYGEFKLAFIIYLWYPKTRGTGYVYETLLRPFVSKHEIDIDNNLQELRFRAWDLAIYYWKNCTDLGSLAFYNVIHYAAKQSSRIRAPSSARDDHHQRPRRGGPPQPSTSGSSQWPLRLRNSKPRSSVSSPRGPRHPNQRRLHQEEQSLPSAPQITATFPALFKSEAHNPKPKLALVELEEAQNGYIHIEEEAHDKSPKNNPNSNHVKFKRSKLKPN